MSRRRVLVLVILLLCLPAGCETLGYYGQAVSGQAKLISQRRSISALINNPDTTETLRQQLQLVTDIRAFAESQLLLPVKDQFTTYADIQRPYVVWNVFAAPEFSLEPKRWCYPVAGCVSYRGYFSEEAARKKADELTGEGLDVYVAGVTAYSTLGWFSDPVLNTVIQRQGHELARLIFHELAHQLVYVKGDTQFNESFATAVEQAGMERWLKATMDESSQALILQEIASDKARGEAFVQLVQGTVTELETLYASGKSAIEMRQQKGMLQEALRVRYRGLQRQWGGDTAYDQWFSRGLNNAQLSTVTTYNALVPHFLAILNSCDEELACFYREVKELSRLNPQQRHAWMTDFATTGMR